MSIALLASAGKGSAPKLYVEDVFSTYIYTGNGSTQTINNGIDLAGKGGMVWTKGRVVARNHTLVDTERGKDATLSSNSTATSAGSYGLSSINSNGYTLYGGLNAGLDSGGESYVSWTFRKAPKFFDVVTYIGDGTTGRTLPHSLGVVPGMIITKRTTASGAWIVYHRGIGATKDLILSDSQGVQTRISSWNDTEPTSSNFSLGAPSYNNTLGETHVAYLYAHDTSADGFIQCGSFSGNTTTTIGWEPQWIMIKRTDTYGDWITIDNMRGCAVGGVDAVLMPNLSSAESVATDYIDFTATGFISKNLTGTYIYTVIRRPNKVPTSGTEVYSSSASSGVIASGFIVDAHLGATRAGLATNHRFHSRLTGGTKELVTSMTAAESTVTDLKFDVMNGLGFSFAASEINHFFKRAKGFFDIVCYTGTGVARTVNHNLGVVPELMIVKNRTIDAGVGTTNWIVRYSSLTLGTGILNTTGSFYDGEMSYWNSTKPTYEVFPLGVVSHVNANATYVAYLFATLAGISKVGSYTGNGTSQTIACGFSAGARFVLIKRTDSAGDWYIWDTVRGIVAGNDPHLSLNTTAAEVTTDDTIDPEASGFIVNQVAATNINVNSATYIYLAIA